VGVFLIETGLEVSRGLKEEGFQYDLATLHLFFESWHAIILWTLPLFLAVLLRVITHFFHHQLIFPTYFFIIPIVFYIVIAIGGWSFEELRAWGWVFDVGAKKQEWWKFYTLFVSKFSGYSCMKTRTDCVRQGTGLTRTGLWKDQLDSVLGSHADPTCAGLFWHLARPAQRPGARRQLG
jgi:hypothetical protein